MSAKKKSLKERLQDKEKEAAEYLERLKRVQAEYENARKRLAREKDEFFQYANEELIAKFLPIVDNFDRALLSDNTGCNEAFLQGIQLIHKQFESILTESGLKRVEGVGKPFDANRHEALAEVENDEYPEHTVIEEVQKGWFLKDRLLRPALVKVSVKKSSKKSDMTDSPQSTVDGPQ